MPDSGLLHVGVNDGCDVLGPIAVCVAMPLTVRCFLGAVPIQCSRVPRTMAAKGIVDHIISSHPPIPVHIMDLNGMMSVDSRFRPTAFAKASTGPVTARCSCFKERTCGH